MRIYKRQQPVYSRARICNPMISILIFQYSPTIVSHLLNRKAIKIWRQFLIQNWEMQRWRSGESARLSPRHMWVEFVVDSRHCSEGFSPGSPVFLPPPKPTLQIPIRSGNEGHTFVIFAVKCHPH